MHKFCHEQLQRTTACKVGQQHLLRQLQVIVDMLRCVQRRRPSLLLYCPGRKCGRALRGPRGGLRR